jgi:hypothetical protein
MKVEALPTTERNEREMHFGMKSSQEDEEWNADEEETTKRGGAGKGEKVGRGHREKGKRQRKTDGRRPTSGLDSPPTLKHRGGTKAETSGGPSFP